jgi:hypothetical protein
MNDFEFADSGLGAPARGRSKKKKKKSVKYSRSHARGTCKTVTFKRAHRGGAVLPKSQWRTVERCTGHHLKATNRKQCKSDKTGRYVRCSARGAMYPLQGAARRRRRRR